MIFSRRVDAFIDDPTYVSFLIVGWSRSLDVPHTFADNGRDRIGDRRVFQCDKNMPYSSLVQMHLYPPPLQSSRSQVEEQGLQEAAVSSLPFTTPGIEIISGKGRAPIATPSCRPVTDTDARYSHPPPASS